MPYYLVEDRYVGPDRADDQYRDADQIEITKEPAMTDAGEPCTDGWCGTKNGWDVYAHGEYERLEMAREAAARIFGGLRDVIDTHDNPIRAARGNAVRAYKPGRYEPMTSWHIERYVGDCSEIDKDMSDAEIRDYIKEEFEHSARQEGKTLGPLGSEEAFEILKKLREEAIEQHNEEEAEAAAAQARARERAAEMIPFEGAAEGREHLENARTYLEAVLVAAYMDPRGDSPDRDEVERLVFRARTFELTLYLHDDHPAHALLSNPESEMIKAVQAIISTRLPNLEK